MNKLIGIAALTSALALTGCGGGGSSDSGASQNNAKQTEWNLPEAGLPFYVTKTFNPDGHCSADNYFFETRDDEFGTWTFDFNKDLGRVNNCNGLTYVGFENSATDGTGWNLEWLETKINDHTTRNIHYYYDEAGQIEIETIVDTNEFDNGDVETNTVSAYFDEDGYYIHAFMSKKDEFGYLADTNESFVYPTDEAWPAYMHEFDRYVYIDELSEAIAYASEDWQWNHKDNA